MWEGLFEVRDIFEGINKVAKEIEDSKSKHEKIKIPENIDKLSNEISEYKNIYNLFLEIGHNFGNLSKVQYAIDTEIKHPPIETIEKIKSLSDSYDKAYRIRNTLVELGEKVSIVGDEIIKVEDRICKLK